MNALDTAIPAKVWKVTLVTLLLGLLMPPLISWAVPGFPFAGDVAERPGPPPPPDGRRDAERPPPPPPGIHPAMLLFDADADGVLSASEIAGAAEVILAMDLDRDGQVNAAELCEAVPLVPPSPGEEFAGLFGALPPSPHPDE